MYFFRTFNCIKKEKKTTGVLNTPREVSNEKEEGKKWGEIARNETDDNGSCKEKVNYNG